MSLPGWQALHAELAPKGLTVVTVALDIDPAKAAPWIAAATPSHPSLVDTAHITDELFGFDNVPMAVWIDEAGVLVRPAESATIEPSTLRNIEITDDMDPVMASALTEIKAMPDRAEDYRAAIVDWVEQGASSRYALRPDQVVERSRPVDADKARAAACFELGQHLFTTVGHDAAVPWWKQAHDLDRGNWTYKRQAWTLVTTPEGADSDLSQAADQVYGTNWLADVKALGGGANYGTEPAL